MNDTVKIERPNFSSNEPGKPGKSPDGSELVTQMDRGTHADNETNGGPHDASTGDDRAPSRPGSLPPWHAEKYHWSVPGTNGKSYLNVNPEFLSAVIKDAPKFQTYGYRCLIDDAGQPVKSEERQAVNDMSTTFALVRESLRGFDESEREDKALKRFLLERCTSNAVYAAITQFEIDNWAARSAATGKDASDHQNFGEKQARRDEFAHNAAVFHAICSNVCPDLKIDADAYAKQARALIYQQARMLAQELQKDTAPNAEVQHARAAAVLASRPFK